MIRQSKGEKICPDQWTSLMIPYPNLEKDVSKSPRPVLEFKESSRPHPVLEASQEDTSSENIHRDQDTEPEKLLMPVSLKNLSLVSEEKESKDFFTKHSDNLECSEEIPSSSKGRPQDPVSNGDGPSSSSPVTCLHFTSPGTHPGPVTSERSQQNYTNAISESANSEVSGQPAGRGQKEQPERAASEKPHLFDSQGDPQADQVLEKATVQYHSGTSQGNFSSNQCWPLNNMPQQISMSGDHPQVSSLPVSYSQPSTPQHSVHNSQQIGPYPHHDALNQTSQSISQSENHLQVSASPVSLAQPSTPQHSGKSSQQGPSHHQEALNQTTQHHYQQQHLLHQQYQLQMQLAYNSIQQQPMHQQPNQQLYQQQQLIQPQQQPLNQQQTLIPLQQQYFQQIHSLPCPQQQFLQHQFQHSPQAQQLWQQQYQQLTQHIQPQEAQQTQQHYLQAQEQQLQLYRQSQELAYQMQQHGYQLLLHQYQGRQQGYQSVQPQQGHLELQQYSHPQPQQHHYLEQQRDEQTHQGHQVTVQHSSGIPAPESEFPEVARQPESAERSRYSVSPYKRTPAHKISPSHSTGTLASEAS